MNYRLAIVQAMLPPLLFGSVPVCVRYVSVNSVSVGIIRLLFAVVALTIIVIYRKKFRIPSRKELVLLVTLGIVFGLHWLTYFWGIKMTSAALGSLAYSTYGIQLIIIGAIFGLHRITKVDLFGIALATYGSFLIFPEISLESDMTWGILSGIASGFFYALLPILHQKGAKIDSDLRTWAQIAFALPVFLVLLPKATWVTDGFEWLLLAYVGLIVTVIGHSLWVRATTTLSTAVCSVVNYLYLPSALFFAWFVLGEEINTQMLTGAALIVGGTGISLWHRIQGKALLAEEIKKIQQSGELDEKKVSNY